MKPRKDNSQTEVEYLKEMNSSLQARIAELENLVDELTQKLEDRDGADPSPASGQSSDGTYSTERPPTGLTAKALQDFLDHLSPREKNDLAKKLAERYGSPGGLERGPRLDSGPPSGPGQFDQRYASDPNPDRVPRRDRVVVDLSRRFDRHEYTLSVYVETYEGKKGQAGVMITRDEMMKVKMQPRERMVQLIRQMTQDFSRTVMHQMGMDNPRIEIELNEHIYMRMMKEFGRDGL